MTQLGSELLNLVAIMSRLRQQCPWDAEQTHRSLAKHLVEETAEVLDAIESGSETDLVEELGDVLLQVLFHAEIARTEDRFDVDDVAKRVADKLIRRHPFVFNDAEVPTDLMGDWEAAKREEKHRNSALDGIPDSLATLARAAKVAARVEHVHLNLDLPDEPVTANEVGRGILELVARAQASGVDADQATRDAIRELEAQVRAAETAI